MDPDRISTFVLHDFASVIACRLTYTYNLSLFIDIFPEVLKDSKTVSTYREESVSWKNIEVTIIWNAIALY